MPTIALDYINFSATRARRRSRALRPARSPSAGGRDRESEQLQHLPHVVLRLGIRRDAAEPLDRRLAGVVGGQRERQPSNRSSSIFRCLTPASMFAPGSYGIGTAYRRAVSGISCIRPIAPFRDRASAW